MKTFGRMLGLHCVAFLCVLSVLCVPVRHSSGADDGLEAGFAEVDITPKVGGKPVYLAGFGKDRKATGVADPLFARAVVLRHGGKKIACVSVDLVGYFQPEVAALRTQLPGFDYVLVSSTHNHEGPDTLGLWGPAFSSGIDPDYQKSVGDKVVQAVREADRSARAVSARIGTATDPNLVRDTRQPIIKHDELVALKFFDTAGKPTGVVVQWNCHPETLSDKNTLVSADYVGYTVAHLREKHGCPVVYLTGTVGGLMTSLGLEVKDEQGTPLKDGTREKTERYGRLIGQLADRALEGAKPVRLTPFEARSKELFLPIDNKLYLAARQLGVLKRAAYLWNGNPYQAEPAGDKEVSKSVAIRSEIGWLRLGELEVAAIPGEIYPELVLGRIPDPAPEGVDFPDAPQEPAIYAQLRGPHRMIVGLANDEIGYILPKRQWDEKSPFAYGLKKAPYGEVNSLGPETAPLLCKAFQDLVKSPK